MSRLTLAFAVGLGVATLSCEAVPLTAPPGAGLFLQANPGFVIANGGRSQVTAFVTEATGTPVADGVQVLFLTTLGRIDETATTRNGIARVFFVADARSGTATVTATLGGEVQGPTVPTPPPGGGSGQARGSSTTSALGDAGGAGAALTAVSRAAAVSASVEITIGSALPDQVILSANPQRITSSRRSTLIANVFDQFGNPVQNVPVIFRIQSVSPAGLPGVETLDSGGSPRFTDSNGQAFDTLFTTAPVGGTQKTVNLEATVPSVEPSTLSVFID